MKKFSELREELNEQILSEEISFGDMSDELLFDLITSECVDEYHFTNALITLYERELVELNEDYLENLFEAPLSAFGSAGEKREAGYNRNAKDLQQSKQMSKLAQSSGPAPRGVSGPTAKPTLPTSVQTKDTVGAPKPTASNGPKPLTARGTAGSNVEAGRAAYTNKAQAMNNVGKLSQSSMSVNQAKSAQAGLDKAIGSSAKTSIADTLKNAGKGVKDYASRAFNTVAKGGIGGAARSAVGAAGKLASKAVAPLSALTTGYEVGKSLNNISAVNNVTDRVGKFIANKISGSPESNVTKATNIPRKSQSEKPVLMGPNQLSRFQQKNPEQKGKVMGVNQQARMDTKNPTTSGQSAKPAVQKFVPKAAPPKPQTNNTMGMSSAAYNDLRASAAKMKSATSDMASKTGAMKSSLQKVAPSGRMERPISPGGQTSSQIHQSISRLGGEPTRPSAPKAVPKAAPAAPAKVSGGAPTTAVGSKPPPLSSKNASGGKWM